MAPSLLLGFFKFNGKSKPGLKFWHSVALCLRTKIPFFSFSPDRLGVKILNEAESYSHQGGTMDPGRHYLRDVDSEKLTSLMPLHG